jgi:hypothetical protein
MQYIALESFLDAKGKLVSPGSKAPDESDENIKKYLDMGLIGGKPGKAPTKKKPTTAEKKATKEAEESE